LSTLYQFTEDEAIDYMNAVAEVFGEQMIQQGLWPSRSPDLNTRNLYSWVTLIHQVSVEYLQSLRKLQE
jgi:hypothetical protein